VLNRIIHVENPTIQPENRTIQPLNPSIHVKNQTIQVLNLTIQRHLQKPHKIIDSPPQTVTKTTNLAKGNTMKNLIISSSA